MDLAEVNFILVILATVVSFSIGALWYSPILFSKPWQKDVGLEGKDIKGSEMGFGMLASAILIFIMVVGLSLLNQMAGGTPELIDGFGRGLMVGIFFVATSYGINIAYQLKPVRLWLIDAGYQVLFLAVSGAILTL